ncbi:sugar transferase [Vibrio natriegens]|uniref:sugar transferase n=1 Tax=Vibrio natriegens TaxID=691 RepID=UPI001FB86E38|nr:sugar transferase [Vibrio natriegens]
MNLYTNVVKPLVDKFFSIFILLLLSPILLLVSIAIVMDSGFPIFYFQKRVGKNGKEFYVFKFRTMINGADKVGLERTSTNDSRITRIGKFLRKSSLDETPQLINVLKGDMSLIGFRPGIKKYYKQNDLSSDIFKVKPGITGLAQVSGRSNLTPEQKRALELKYANEISFLLDVKILLLTIIKVVTRASTN